MSKSRSYQEELMGYLQDPETAVAYLNAALDEGDSELFLLALQNVAKARGKDIALTDGEPFLAVLRDLGLGLTLMQPSKVS